MIDALSFAIALACVGCAVASAVPGRAGRSETGPSVAVRLLPAVWVIEAALVLQAVLDVAALLGGHRPRNTPEHLCYVALSLATLPIVLTQARRYGRAAAIVLGVGLLFVAVIVVRMQTTWRPGVT